MRIYNSLFAREQYSKNQVKVLLLNTYEKSGGAAIACRRLMQALHKNNIDVKMLVLNKQTDCKQIHTVSNNHIQQFINKFRFLWERIVIWLNNRLSRNNLFTVSIANTGCKIDRHPLVEWADIIHLHWINQGFLSLKTISRLTQSGKPIVWTMHDQWAYTGICHYTSGCSKYYTECNHCIKLKCAGSKDLSWRTFEEKKKLYQSKKITLLGCSKWISHEAGKSTLSHDLMIHAIPNAIDCSHYRKNNKEKACQSFNLPINSKLILFGACKVTDERKGFYYLKKACDNLYQQKKIDQEEVLIVVFGGKSEELSALLPYPVYNIGYINDVQAMVDLYNAVDLFVIPSLEDNLPNTIMEAMACGTPCVGFDTGGIPEMIDHKQNGYVAAYKDAEDLANGIYWVLKEADQEGLSKNAREKVETKYSEDVVAKQHIALYHNILT